jgi:hypothetical protein
MENLFHDFPELFSENLVCGGMRSISRPNC